MRKEIIIITVLLIIILGLAAQQYIFSIYETEFEVSEPSLFADSASTITVTAKPLNSFGWRAPFRSVSVRYEIREGADLIEVVQNDLEKATLVLRAKDKTGTVVIIAHSEYSIFPTVIEVRVEPNLA